MSHNLQHPVQPQEALTRRQFAAAAAAAAVPALTASPAAHSAPEPAAAPTEPVSPIDLWLAIVLAEHRGPPLDEASIAEIRSELAAQLERSRRLGAVPLANGDEPAFAFGAFRGD